MTLTVNHFFRHESFPFDLDQWYPIMEPITFKTYFIPLKLEQAEAIIQYYSTFYIGKGTFTREHTIILEELEKQIDHLFETTPGLREKGSFLRLCGRSPKDGEPNNPQRFYDEYRSNLEYLSKEKHLDINEGNTKIWAIAKTHWLIVKNAKDCLSLLLSSHKVYQDLSDWRDFGGKEQLCFREWDKDLDDDNEYRGFIYESKLTAITQYDHFGRFDDIIKTKEKVEKMIHEFWSREVKPRMKVDSYIVDFGYVNGKIILIEISPFLRTTGAGVLNWDDDAYELRYGSGKLKVASKANPNADRIASQFEEQWQDSFDYKENFVYENFEQPKKIDNNQKSSFVFVASVLKSNCFWNKKYLTFGKLIGEAKLMDHMLAIDCNGMGWIVDGFPQKYVKGELWLVNNEDLRDIQYFFEKDCQKVGMTVTTVDGNEYKDVVCFVRVEKKKDSERIVEEFTLDDNKNFNNIANEERKQEKYLNISYKYPMEEDEK